MQLYTHALSPYSAKVRIALAEKGLDYEEIQLPVGRAGILSKPPELLAANPRGQVPTLIDGGNVLYDSSVICEYLEELHPDPPLVPANVAERARARRLEDDADWLMGTAIADLLAETFRKPDVATRDRAKIAAATAAIRAGSDRLESELANSESLCSRFSNADVASFVAVAVASAFEAPPGHEHPHVAAWAARVGSRPCVAREFAAIREALAKLPD
jgi:glutathione S-transferase